MEILCSKCKLRPRAPSHKYCRKCRNEAVRKCINSKGGDWAYALADENRHKKALARKLLYNWLIRGKIKRQPCEVCGDPNSQFHHDDYSKPSVFRHLCLKHHKEADKKKEFVDRMNRVG